MRGKPTISARIVSIHAPRAERDDMKPLHSTRATGFNPRAPGGARLAAHTKVIVEAGFQSTRPGRSATSTSRYRSGTMAGFNPRAPGGARQRCSATAFSVLLFQSTRPGRSATLAVIAWCLQHKCFNPRAPGGARRRLVQYDWFGSEFQSTRPGRSATKSIRDIGENSLVSIHAPRAERDLASILHQT